MIFLQSTYRKYLAVVLTLFWPGESHLKVKPQWWPILLTQSRKTLWKGFGEEIHYYVKKSPIFFSVCIWELYNVIKNGRVKRGVIFFSGCEGQDFDSYSFTRPFLLIMLRLQWWGLLDVRLLVITSSRLPLMVSCLVPMNSWPTCPLFWLHLGQVLTLVWLSVLRVRWWRQVCLSERPLENLIAKCTLFYCV